MTRPGMLGDEGQRVLERETGLFPRSVRPAFLRLLWIVLAVLAVLAAVLFTAIGARLA
jgi:hypothetical protein